MPWTVVRYSKRLAENGNPIAARKALCRKSARDRVGLCLEIAVAEATLLPGAQIDDRDFVEIAVL